MVPLTIEAVASADQSRHSSCVARVLKLRIVFTAEAVLRQAIAQGTERGAEQLRSVFAHAASLLERYHQELTLDVREVRVHVDAILGQRNDHGLGHFAAFTTEVEIHELDATAILTAQVPDLKLQPRDIVFVAERPWIRGEELLDAAANAFVTAAVVTWTGEKITR